RATNRRDPEYADEDQGLKSPMCTISNYALVYRHWARLVALDTGDTLNLPRSTSRSHLHRFSDASLSFRQTQVSLRYVREVAEAGEDLFRFCRFLPGRSRSLGMSFVSFRM